MRADGRPAKRVKELLAIGRNHVSLSHHGTVRGSCIGHSWFGITQLAFEGGEVLQDILIEGPISHEVTKCPDIRQPFAPRHSRQT